jgi:hypothetical protein
MASTAAPFERADWRLVEALYWQLANVVDADPEFVMDAHAGALAEALGRVIAAYEGTEDLFLEDLASIFSSIEGLQETPEKVFKFLYTYPRLDRNPAYRSPRRPRPFEAAVETARRLRDANSIREALETAPSAGLLGGSASYGRFFNTRGNHLDSQGNAAESSDLDLLVVVPDQLDLAEIGRRLAVVPFLAPDDVKSFSERASHFSDLAAANAPLLFSHKLWAWTHREDAVLAKSELASYYKVSIHIASLSTFNHIILADMPSIRLPSGVDSFIRRLYDYRDTPPLRRDVQTCFAGIKTESDLQTTPVKGGYITTERVAHITGERYYPGLHQNLVLPQFELRWQMPSVRLTLALLAFRWKILARLTDERRMRPHELQHLAFSHTRSQYFAPHIRRRALRGTDQGWDHV